MDLLEINLYMRKRNQVSSIRKTRSHYNNKVLVGLVLGAISLVAVVQWRLVSAADSPWTQTDWSGGEGSSTTNQYASSSNINASTAGEIKLSLDSEELTNTGFETDILGWEAGLYAKNVSGLKAWFKADAITGLSDGAAVSTWDDSSASNYDLTQGGGINQPLYKTNIINGKPVVRFDGSNDYMQNTSISGFTSAASVLLMQKINGNQNAGSYELGYNSGVNTGISNIPWGGTHYSRVGGAGNGDITWAYTIPYTNLISQVYNGGSTSHKAWENGTLKNTTTVSASFSNSPNTLTVGALAPSSYWLQTDIAEYILFTSALTDSNRKGLEAYIQHKWGLSSTYHTITRDTDTKRTGAASIKVVAQSQDTPIWQELNVGDTDTYVFNLYAYTDGSAVDGTDAVLISNGNNLSTTYTADNGGWYKLSATVSGASSARDFGVKVLNGATVYLDDLSIKKYHSSGTLTSNIFDTEFPSDWGELTYSTSGSGTVAVKVRSGNTSNLSDATDWSSCSAILSGSDISDSDCADDMDRYVQYQLILTPSSGESPVVESISLAFSASDSIDPTTNASSVAITGITNGSWANSEPTITWTAGADNGGGSGLLGYCVSLNEENIAAASSQLDPESSAGALAGIDDGVSSDACPFIATGTSLDLSALASFTLTTNKRYYFSIKAVDLAGNVYSGLAENYQDLVNFKYDNTSPTNVAYISTPSGNFGSVNDMFFTWPISGASAGSDSQSGIIGWQYSLNGTSNWTGPDTNSDLGIDLITSNGSTSEHFLTEGDDGANIAVGNNTIYFRTIDAAGNFSTSVTGGISYGGAAPTFGGGSVVTITPSTSTTNSFALSWPAASVSTGTLESYYYMVNTTPPSTLATLTGNSTLYIPTTSTSVSAQKLTGAVRGSNTVYLVAVDTEDNYSPSNYISGTFTLNSTNPDAPQNLSVSDTSIKSEEIWRASLAWDQPSYKGTGSLTYKIQRSTDNSTWTNVTTTTGLSYTDTVDESTTYYYRIGTYDTSDESEDAPTYSSSVEILPKGAYDEAATLSSGPTVSNITTKKALIEWSTSRTADSKVQYGTKSGDYFDDEASRSEQVTSHEIQLTNLEPGTKYYYKTKWTDEDGNTGESSEKTFSTDPAPKISAIKVTNIGITAATVNFIAKSATKIKIYYGKTNSFGSVIEQSTSASESAYSIVLNGLDDNTKYFFKINAFDSEDAEYQGNELDFVTLPRPQITNVRVQQAKNTAQPTAVISWSTNTEVSSIASYYPTGNPSAARDEVDIALLKGEHRMIIRGLLPNTRYDLKVSGRDVAGNEAVSDILTFTTSTDTRPPLLSDVKVEGSSAIKSTQTVSSQLVITWTTDEAATSQVEFGEGTNSAYTQKTQEDANLTFNHLVVIPNLTPSKVYHLRAISKDTAGNASPSVDIVTITPKATENALDLVVTNLREVFNFIK